MRRFFFGKKKPEFYKGLLIKADRGLHEQIAKKIAEQIPIGSKILDLGAGEGALTSRLLDMGYYIVAADMNQEEFKCTEAEFHQINFDVKEDIERFVADNLESFDAVLGIEVIEHVENQWEYVRQLKKMLKPNGLMIITTPNTTSWLSRMKFLLTGRFHQFSDKDLDYGHISPITPWELGLILKQECLSQISIEPAGTLPAIYITGLNRETLLSLMIFPIRPVLKGLIDGWCVLAIGRKS